MSGVRRRALGAGVALLMLALALGASAVVSAVAARYSVRLDVTGAGDQRLAPRTLSVLGQAAALGVVEIAVAVDAQSLEPWSRRSVNDVLDLFEHAGRVRASEIDVGSAGGQTDFAALLERLVEREREGVDRHVDALGGAADAAEQLAAQLEEHVNQQLLALRDQIPPGDEAAETARAGLGQWATLARLSAARLREAAAAARAALTQPDPTLPIPPLETHEATLQEAIEERADELRTLAEELRVLAGASIGGSGIRSASAAMARSIAAMGDEAARAADALGGLPKLDVLRVAGALGTAELALVIGPAGTGVVGIDVGMLYEPQVVASDGSRVTGDVRFQAEELFASAIASVLSTAEPIVVLTHGESSSIMENAGYFASLRERLERRGIDLAEWRTLLDPEPPDLGELDPEGIRPVVYAALAPDASSAARSAEDVAGPERAAALGRALRGLIAERESILLSATPSVLPSYGEPDPVAEPFRDLGIDIRTGTMLLHNEVGVRTQTLRTEFEVVPRGDEHPVLSAIRNLRTLLPYPVPIAWSDEGAVVEPLLVVDEDPATWGETQWLRLWQTPREQRPLLPDKPRFHEGADDGEGPWAVAVAAERADAGGSRAGRVVIVGANGWFFDPIAARRQLTDGRIAPAWPGNAELFEASVLWLAGQDELIAQSAGARAAPLVGPLDRQTLSLLRWGLLAGLPLLTLAAGVVWRLARG